MASLTLKNLPDPLLERLRERAAADRRSLTQEILFLLEDAMRRPTHEPSFADETRSQLESWRALLGQWRSELDPDEEISRILSTRTSGRDIEL